MTAQKIVLSLSFTVLVALCAAFLPSRSTAGEQSQGGILDVLDRQREAQAQQMEGSWEIFVTPVLPPGAPPVPSTHAYGTFARGGGYVGADRLRPASKQHGVWQHLGGNQFALTAKEDLFDAQGAFAGTLKIRGRLTLTGQDTVVGVAEGEVRDASGALVPGVSGCTTVKATRIKLEAPAAQCLSITPPQ